MEKVDLVIFDMDGLLFDTESTMFVALRRAAEKAGFNLTEDIYKQLIGTSDKRTQEILVEKFGEGFIEKQVFAASRAEYQKILESEGLTIKPGVAELLDVLDQRNIRRCIASSSNLEVIAHYLSLTGLTDRFDFYVSGTEVEHSKPNPDIFLLACERANKKPENALVLEDSYNGLIASVKAGIRCIIVPDMIEPNEEMQNLAYKICGDLNEVADLINK